MIFYCVITQEGRHDTNALHKVVNVWKLPKYTNSWPIKLTKVYARAVS